MAELDLQTGQTANFLRGREVVVATGKRLAFQQFMEILGESLGVSIVYDPETLAVNFQQAFSEMYEEVYEEEPANENPQETVEWKLARRLHELVQAHLKDLKDYLVIASDVAFKVNNQSLHRPSRKAHGGNELDLVAEKQALLERYQQPFQAEWQVAFGMAENDQISSTMVAVHAQYPALTAEEIELNFDAQANPGLHLVELGHERGVMFSISSNGTDPIICDTPELRQLVDQFIIKKVPTFEMIQALYEACISQQPDQLGLVAQAAANLPGIERDLTHGDSNPL